MSIRLRLTLLYSAILACTLVAFSGLLYTAQARSTLNIVKNDLIGGANRILPFLAYGEPVWDHTRSIPRTPMGMDLRGVRPRDIIRLLNAEGVPFEISINEEDEDLPLSAEGLANLQQGKPWVEIGHLEQERVLTYSVPVIHQGQVVAIVQVGRSLADRDRALRALGITLILGSLSTTVVAFGMGWVLSGVTLRPIHRITQTAQEIGETRDFSSRVPYKGPNDELGRLARTFNDMLSRLQDAYQQVMHTLQVQRDFVADVSHELRTPLTTICGNLALLRRKPPLPFLEQEDVLEDLSAESERLIRLVNDLLVLARADAGRKLKREPVVLGPLIDDVCRQTRLLQPEWTIECDIPDGTTVVGDPDALKQVLLILLDNALKHAHDPVRVQVDEMGHQVAIHVRDSGPGMPLELRERIFDRFYRGETSRSTPGFGLGLSIARALVEAQGGTIEIESEVQTGSTFSVVLPYAGKNSTD